MPGSGKSLNNPLGLCWAGIWTGTYPVQFVSPIVMGVQHNYELSYSSGYLALNTGDSPSPMNPSDISLPPQAYIHLFENMSLGARSMTLKATSAVPWRPRHSSCKRMIIIGLCSRNSCWFTFVALSMSGCLCGRDRRELSAALSNHFASWISAPWGNPLPDAVLYYVAGAGEVVPQGTTTTFENYRSCVRHLRSTVIAIVHAFSRRRGLHRDSAPGWGR